MVEVTDWHHRAIESQDSRFDGFFVVGLPSRGVYCRPSCPERLRGRRDGLQIYAIAAAALAAGLRACSRCRPDEAAGPPDWGVRSDIVGRAMRLIGDGVVDREGVSGLARRLAISERHLGRMLRDEVGAGPLAIARARRAQTAWALIEHTALPFGEVASAAGFSSQRQFNDTVRELYGAAPSQVRRGTSRTVGHQPGLVALRLPVRLPFCAEVALGFLGERAIPGVEEVQGAAFRRVVTLPSGLGVVELEPAGADGHVLCTLRLDDLADLGTAIERCRRLLDLDADPCAVDEALGADPLLRELVRCRPGLRSPGAVDGCEIAVRAILGQQVSVRAARTQAQRLAEAIGRPLPEPSGGLLRAFPTPDAVADAPDAALPVPAARRNAIRAVARAVASGEIVLDAGADREESTRRLLAERGVGPWTAAYVSMRALNNPDVLLGGDLGVKNAFRRLGVETADVGPERWRPWRSYATHHLWASLGDRPIQNQPLVA